MGARAAGNVADPSAIAEVLGSAADWKITPAQPELGSGPGTTLMGTGGQALSLESTSKQTAPSECLVSFRLKPAKGTSASINLQMACGERPDKTPQSLNFSVWTTEGLKDVSYSMSVVGGKPPPPPPAPQPPPLNGTLHFEAVSDRSLTWSEEMRKSIDAQIASAPRIEETLLTLRCTVDKGRARMWVNGRFAFEVPMESDMDPSGLVKVQLTAGAALASIRVHPLAAVEARFEPLSIAGHLNSSMFGGEKIDPASLPWASSPDKIEKVDGVPFQFPTLSAKGEDHIDVGTSWTRFGALPGYFLANGGTFGGRWISADHIDPARIAMYIPQGRYKALHLVAVSDDRENSVPVVSAQFYRPDAGHPINFAGTVPPIKGDTFKNVTGKSQAVPIKVGGKSTELYHVTIPLDPDSFSWFTDLNRIGMEITKQVQFYRAYPDPLEYSYHGAGLPSSVQIYAMTLERAGVEVDIQPDQFGHVWTAPTQPGYSVELRNSTGAATTAKLVIETKSYDGKDTDRQEKSVELPANGAAVKVPVTLKPRRYGLQEMTLTLTAGDETSTYRRNFAHLHPDTREQSVWEDGRGPIFGYWPWGGGHVTPSVEKEISVMGAAGAETCTANYSLSATEIKTLEEKDPAELKRRRELQSLAEKHHYIAESAFTGGPFYAAGFYAWCAAAPKWDPAKPEECGKALVDVLRPTLCETNAISRPTYLPFFAEPQIGSITMGTWPSHYGVDYQLTKAEQDVFHDMLAKYLAGARAVRKEWPSLKLLLPYGDPMNAVVFLKLSPESRDLIDGCALDLPGFERLPEQQVTQVVLNRLYPIMKDIREYKKNPYFVLIEGTHISSKDIDTGQDGQADISIRNFLLFMGYGVNRFESGNAPFDCANYWGENHYGGGWSSRLPLAMPKLAYANYATITRHLNRANFTKYLPTGSTSTYCQQFKHYKTGKLIHVLWTIRGKRPVTVKVPAGTSLEIYDQNDNATTLHEKNGAITFTVDKSPQYLEGLTADAAISLGPSDHSDAQPAKEIEKLGNLSDGWKLVEKEDLEYTKNKPLQIERFLGKMNAKSVDAPDEPGGKALAIHLQKQDKDRGVMPFYTTLEPRDPITIEGKASHLGLWVNAASDWGRMVYVLRDAKGEKWISIGSKEEWNCDDIHAWSAFCFDGWRYLRFELPSNSPYDSFREYGSSWWGSYGGDNVVDLPLKLEKIIVERRAKVVYGNDLVNAKSDDVMLGDLNAEYASAADKNGEVVEQSRLRMPTPKNAPELSNPIAELAKTGVGAPTRVQKVTDPQHQYDGTRCHVHFDPVAGAKTYDAWVSAYPDGRGALQLGKDLTESGKLIEGMRPDVEFYLFVVYTDKDGKLSKPSEPFKFMLKDRFGYK